jgi:hypothetical protein
MCSRILVSAIGRSLAFVLAVPCLAAAAGRGAPGIVIPEPATTALLGVGACAFVARRCIAAYRKRR